MSTKNYVFNASPPTLNAGKVSHQMYLGHQYRNKLCELERTRREKARLAAKAVYPEFAAVSDRLVAAEEAEKAAISVIKQASAKARKSVPPTPEMAAALAVARTELKEARAAEGPIRKKAYAALKALQAPYREQAAKIELPPKLGTRLAKQRRIDEYHRLTLAVVFENGSTLNAGQEEWDREQKAARARCGVWWGSYLIVEDAMAKAHMDSPPQFKRWNGDGTIGVQIQSTAGRCSSERALACVDDRLQIELSNEEELATTGKSRGLRAVGKVRLRIGTEKKQPLWTEVPVTFHRPLPAKGCIRYAYLHRIRIGLQERWKLRLTIVEENVAPRAIPEEIKGKSVAVHLGYRILSDGSLRVASCKTSDGKWFTHTLSPDHLNKAMYDDHLKSIRDRNRNEWLEQFTELMQTFELPAPLPPEPKEPFDPEKPPKPFHLGTALHDMVDWLSPERFHVMWRKWWEMRLARIGHTVESFLGEKGGYFGLNQEQRAELKVKRMARRRELTDKAAWHDTFVGETHLFEHMNDWRRQDKHLADWECFQRAKSIARRDQDYRSFSKSLAMQYEKIILADINWAELARKRELQNDGEQTDNLTNLQRRRGRLAAPGVLSQFLKERFAGDVVLVNKDNIMNSCHMCGQKQKMDRVKIDHTCTACNQRWDQDKNGAENQLARGLERIANKQGNQKKVTKSGGRNRRKDQIIKKNEDNAKEAEQENPPVDPTIE